MGGESAVFRRCSTSFEMDTMLGAAMQLELVAKAPEVATFPRIAVEENKFILKLD